MKIVTLGAHSHMNTFVCLSQISLFLIVQSFFLQIPDQLAKLFAIAHDSVYFLSSVQATSLSKESR